jgi:hypothetical protein
VPTPFKRLTENGDTLQLDYPPGTRALQLPDSQIASYFLKNFGKPDRIQTCECERSAEPSIAQVLHLSNGDTLNNKLRSQQCQFPIVPGGDSPTSTDSQIAEAFLTTLSRPPTAGEQMQFRRVLAASPGAGQRAVWEDIYWALLSSKEFLFSH